MRQAKLAEGEGQSLGTRRASGECHLLSLGIHAERLPGRPQIRLMDGLSDAWLALGINDAPGGILRDIGHFAIGQRDQIGHSGSGDGRFQGRAPASLGPPTQDIPGRTEILAPRSKQRLSIPAPGHEAEFHGSRCGREGHTQIRGLEHFHLGAVGIGHSQLDPIGTEGDAERPLRRCLHLFQQVEVRIVEPKESVIPRGGVAALGIESAPVAGQGVIQVLTQKRAVRHAQQAQAQVAPQVRHQALAVRAEGQEVHHLGPHLDDAQEAARLGVYQQDAVATLLAAGGPAAQRRHATIG